jgi:hypothetical protein
MFNLKLVYTRQIYCVGFCRVTAREVLHGLIRGGEVRRVNATIFALGLCLAAGRCQAIPIGVLSYDTFIPDSSASPGISAFDLSNLTGAFALPPDFPVDDSLTFQSARLTLTRPDLTQQTFSLGDIGPGFLLDSGGNPLIQVSAATVYSSAEFTATLVPATFALDDGTTFTADSAAIDIVLAPSAGSSLVAGVDLVPISMDQSTGVVPEPASVYLLGVAALGLGMRFFRAGQSRRRSEN